VALGGWDMFWSLLDDNSNAVTQQHCYTQLTSYHSSVLTHLMC